MKITIYYNSFREPIEYNKADVHRAGRKENNIQRYKAIGTGKVTGRYYDMLFSQLPCEERPHLEKIEPRDSDGCASNEAG